ncbi:unnamed protein product [Staurois parvus]|uniref:Uncharacterized protein n=1 Tax=Staurois parvus TaxID=386267 RepID=A0ABN9ALF5_9NEOB|nr:unnamed protein product [Staurois parvus]
MCPLSGLSFTHWLVCNFCYGHRVLQDYWPHIAAARPLICHGPLYYPASSCCCQVQRSLMGPCTASPIACCLPSATLCCHVPLSGLFTLLVC